MVDKPWKKTERQIAKWINGRRIPITGRERGDVPDVAHQSISVEVKHRKRLPGYNFYRDALDQAVAAIREEDQCPIVFAHQSGIRHQNDFVVMFLKDFKRCFLDDEGQTKKLKTVWRGLDSEDDGVREAKTEDVSTWELVRKPLTSEEMAELARRVGQRVRERLAEDDSSGD